MSLTKIILSCSLFIFLACSNKSEIRINENSILKNYCENCKSDTISVTLQNFKKSISSILYSDSVRWKGVPLDSVRIESGIVNYFPNDSLETNTLKNLGITYDTSAIKDYVMFKFNEFGFLETSEVKRFGDMKEVLIKLTYSQDTLLNIIDIYSPMAYYPKYKPMETFLFNNNGTILKISNNLLK